MSADDRALRHIEQLRSYRVRPRRDGQVIADLVAGIERDATRSEKKFGAIADLWTMLLPEDLLDHCRLKGLRAGVLHVVVDSASALYELNRQLGEGLEDELRRRFGGTLLRIRSTVGRLDG